MKIFRLNRKVDVSGTSGAGIVAYGTIFGDGKAVLFWKGELSSVAIYDNIDILMAIHSHSGATELEYLPMSKRVQNELDTFISGHKVLSGIPKLKRSKKTT